MLAPKMGRRTFSTVIGLAVLTAFTLSCGIAKGARRPLTVSIPLIPPAIVGQNYNSGNGGDSKLGAAVLNISGGSAPYACRVVGGKLPPSMSLSEVKPVSAPDGMCILKGTPAAPGDFMFTVQVTDSLSDHTNQKVAFVVCTAIPPIISEIAATAKTATLETITWKTDVPADSQVLYGEYSSYNVASAIQDTNGVTNHSVTIAVRPVTSYGFVVVSRGIAGGAPADYLIAFGPLFSSTFRAGIPSLVGTLALGMQGVGPHNVIQGFPSYVLLYNWYSSGVVNYKGGTLKFQVTGIPPHTQVHWPDVQDSGCGANCGAVGTTKAQDDTFTPNSGPGYSVQFELLQNVGGNTPPGAYTLTVTMYANGRVAASFPWATNITAPVSIAGTPSQYPAIPGLPLWQSNMLAWGKHWAGTATPGCEGCVAYYDGMWVYQQIANYTGKEIPWAAGSQGVRSAYRDKYVLANPKGVVGREVFPNGLFYDCKVNSDATSCKALHQLASQAVGWQMLASQSAYEDPLGIREACYMLGAKRLDYDAGGGTRLTQVKQMAAYCLGDIDQVVNYGGYEEPFFDGLAARALIEFYGDANTGNGDVRVPGAVQELADHLWNKAWLPWTGSNGMFYYATPAYGQFGPVLMNRKDNSIGTGLTNLNLLMAPMYAWLYKTTGQQRYQLEGDTIWYAGVNVPPASGVGMSGKNFSQNYMWSFDYVKWRSAP